MSRHRKLQLNLNGPFSVSAHMYVMILNGNLHMSKHQKKLSNRIFDKEERERKLHNVQFLGESNGFPL